MFPTHSGRQMAPGDWPDCAEHWNQALGRDGQGGWPACDRLRCVPVRMQMDYMLQQDILCTTRNKSLLQVQMGAPDTGILFTSLELHERGRGT